MKATPIRSVLSFRLFTSNRASGSLNVYAERPHAFGSRAEELGYVVATHAAVALSAVRRERQSHSALASRDSSVRRKAS